MYASPYLFECSPTWGLYQPLKLITSNKNISLLVKTYLFLESGASTALDRILLPFCSTQAIPGSLEAATHTHNCTALEPANYRTASEWQLEYALYIKKYNLLNKRIYSEKLRERTSNIHMVFRYYVILCTNLFKVITSLSQIS